MRSCLDERSKMVILIARRKERSGKNCVMKIEIEGNEEARVPELPE